MPTEWAWLTAATATLGYVFYAARNTLASIWRYIEALVLVRIDLGLTGIPAWVLYRWLKDNGRMLHAANRPIGWCNVAATENYLIQERDWVENWAGLNGTVPTLYRLMPLPAIWLIRGKLGRRRCCPLWISQWGSDTPGKPALSGESGGSTTNVHYALRLITFRWFVDYEQLQVELHKLQGKLTYELHGKGRYSVIRCNGSVNSWRQMSAARSVSRENSDPSAPAAAPAGTSTRTTAEGKSQQTAFPFEELGEEPLTMRLGDIRRGLNFGSRLIDLWLSDEAEELLQELRFWKQSRRWFTSRGIPWRRGYGLVGRPGTGKTSVIRAAAAELGLPIFLYDISTYTNEELTRHWTDMTTHQTPCFCVLEDLDRKFDKTKAVEGTMVSFDCLLNLLDGLEQSSGLCVFVTANKPELLDEALMTRLPTGQLISRPGRIDRVIEFKPPTAAGRRKIAQRIMVGLEEHIEATIAAGEQDSGAEFQQRCFVEALRLFWLKESDHDQLDTGTVAGAQPPSGHGPGLGRPERYEPVATGSERRGATAAG